MTGHVIPAARLHGPRDLRIDSVSHPGDPATGEALVRVETVGICGSDLHAFRHGSTSGEGPQGPIVMGHEFAGTIEQVGDGAFDGEGRPLAVGARVAVDPAQPCGICEWCLRGDPNLCPTIKFCGLWPTDGALRPFIRVPADTCFPVPDGIGAATAAMLEPLGVAIHAMDLAKLSVGESLAVIGTGSIGLCTLQLAAFGHAGPVFAADQLPWRADYAAKCGANVSFCSRDTDIVREVLNATNHRGVDVVIEATTGGGAVQQGAEMLAPGGRLIVVGIDEEDQLTLRHSTARRKGLTIRMVRRMKHAYPRAMRLAAQRGLDLTGFITHWFPLEQSAEAFALNADYRDGVIKVMIEV
jgi:L-iditol 2-dehydrogenase